MIIILILLTVIAIFSFNDLVPVYRKKQWKVFWVYAAAMALHVFVAVLIRNNVEIPSPAEPIENLIMFLFGQHSES